MSSDSLRMSMLTEAAGEISWRGKQKLKSTSGPAHFGMEHREETQSRITRQKTCSLMIFPQCRNGYRRNGLSKVLQRYLLNIPKICIGVNSKFYLLCQEKATDLGIRIREEAYG